MSIGAVCLPLNVSTPAVRLATIVEHSSPSILLVGQKDERVDQEQEQAATLLEEACNPCGAKTISISEVVVVGGKGLTDNTWPSAKVGADDRAMILYTSGSTGVPKGIVLRQGGLRNWVESARRLMGTGIGAGGEETDTVLQQASCSFDMCFLQIFFALGFGSTLCLVPTNSHRADAVVMTEIIAAEARRYQQQHRRRI